MNTDKELQTILTIANIANKWWGGLNFEQHIEIKNKYPGEINTGQNGIIIIFLKENSFYIHTPEELAALKVKWQREAADKAFQAGEIRGEQNCEFGGNSCLPDRLVYLNTHYPNHS